MKTLLTFIGISVVNICFACDFCGCFMGITPYDNQSSISLMYRYKSYNGYNNTGQKHILFPKKIVMSSGNANSYASTNGNANLLKHGGTPNSSAADNAHSQNDYELYSTAELRANYFVHERVELKATIPFVMNKSRTNETIDRVSGIGDINLFIAYHLIRRTMTEKFQHRLIVGAGVKLATGNYRVKNDSQERVDFTMQSGTGSVDIPVYLNYVFAYKKLGISFNSTYKFNSDNAYHERVCNSSSNYLNLFYKFREKKDLKIFPSLQGYYEFSKGICIGDVYEPATKMESITSGIGLDLFYKNISLGCSFQMPLYEKRYNENMAMAGKVMLNLTYSFDQKKYLIHSKKINQ